MNTEPSNQDQSGAPPQDGAKLFAALPGSVSEGQAWIVEYLCALRPWLRKATWEDVCAKMRDHAPDIYALLSARGKTPNPKLTRWRGRNQKLKGPLPMKNEKQTESQTASQGAAHGSRLVLQRRYLPASHMPKTWTEWHDHPEPQQIAWGPGSYVTLEENMKTACEGFYARGQGCEFRMVRRMNETLWEYSANK
jgi:hypothetical protein